MDNRIDANILGISGYTLLQRQGVIPNKKVDKLTDAEKKQITDTLKANAIANVNGIELNGNKDDDRRAMFMSTMFCSVIGYINGLDMNEFISFTARKPINAQK